MIVGEATSTLAGLSRPTIFTVGGETFTANPIKFSVAGTTLSAGGPEITLYSTLISLDASGSLLIGTSTIPLHIPPPAVITTDGQVFTVEQGGLTAVDGVTLSSGGPSTTISGTPVSVSPAGLVIWSDRVPLPTVSGSGSSPVAPFAGSVPKSAELSRLILWGALGMMMAVWNCGR